LSGDHEELCVCEREVREKERKVQVVMRYSLSGDHEELFKYSSIAVNQ
jgi:hypothetical protein